jgi:hypothetical protein
MKKSKKILLKWAATYGEDESDVKASMYNEDVMIEFAKYYHKQKLTLTDVSERKLPHWARPLIAIVTMSLSTLFVIYRVFYVC